MKVVLLILMSICWANAYPDYHRKFMRKQYHNGPPPKWNKFPQPKYTNIYKRPSMNFPVRKPNLQMQHQGINPYNVQYQNKPKFQLPVKQHQMLQPQLIQKPQHFVNNQKPMSYPVKFSQPPITKKPSYTSLPLTMDAPITNNLAMSLNTIKQVGEKGPIKTIPAPNLTPADKPFGVRQETYLQQPSYHQYQVTEQSERMPIRYSQAPKESYDNAKIHYGSNFRENQPQAPDDMLYSSSQQIVAQEKKFSLTPEYHSFNYDEQTYRNNAAKSNHQMTSGVVTSTYSISPDKNDQITQAQIVQNYFGTRSQNDVEPDAKPSGFGKKDEKTHSSEEYEEYSQESINEEEDLATSSQEEGDETA